MARKNRREAFIDILKKDLAELEESLLAEPSELSDIEYGKLVDKARKLGDMIAILKKEKR